MNLNDYLTSNYITLYRKNFGKGMTEIPFDTIKLTEMFQKVNASMELDAQVNARNMIRTSGSAFRKRLATFGYNMIVSDNGDGTYNLLFGVQAYKTLEKVFKFKEEKSIRKGYEPLRPYVRTFVTDLKNREEILDYCHKNFELTINVNMDYVDESELEEDYDKIDEEAEKIHADSTYNPIVVAYPRDNRLHLLNGDEIYFSRKYAGKERIKVRIAKDE